MRSPQTLNWCIHNTKLYSTIFTTKNKELAIFGKTLSKTREKLIAFFEAFERGGIKGQDGIIDTFFSKSKKSPLTPELLADFENFKYIFNNSSLSAEALAEQMKNVDQKIIDYAKTCKNGEMTTEGFTASVENMSFSAKTGKIALGALATAGNMLAMWVISKGVELIVKGIDNLANASKHAAESAQVLASEMNASISSMSSNASTLSALNDEYQTLSKGVNKLGENIGLSTKDYSRYKDIINQISTIMPSLTTYFNAQGEKIAFAKGELEDLNKEYDEHIKNQAIDFVTNGDSKGHKIQDILDNYNNNESLSGFEKFWNDFKTSRGFGDLEDFTTKEIISVC